MIPLRSTADRPRRRIAGRSTSTTSTTSSVAAIVPPASVITEYPIQLYSEEVSRSRPPGRLKDVISAATRVFADKGYSRTQVADVAREARLSVGALYGYAENKDALFHWCIEAAVD